MCDKHVVKMIVESAQMLSTAHRVLDGSPTIRVSSKGRNIKHWKHPNSDMDRMLCLPTMVNHPCTKWVMQSSDNYEWLYDHGIELLRQYTLRYDKVHSMQALYMNYLIDHPTNISVDKQTPFAQAMPEQYRCSDAVTAYRNYYIGEKKRFAKWAKTPTPSWF
jgi:hypothetical protein